MFENLNVTGQCLGAFRLKKKSVLKNNLRPKSAYSRTKSRRFSGDFRFTRALPAEIKKVFKLLLLLSLLRSYKV